MLFSLRPKENRKELFGRDKELKQLYSLIKSEWVIILGKRMTGKTSLVKTFINEVKGLYINLMGVNSIRGFVEELARNVTRLNIEIDLRLLRFSWTKMAEDIFSKLEGKIIALDEVQELPVNYFQKLLKKVWDSYDIRLIMTGSMIGILRTLLEPKGKSPLLGRKPAVINLSTFDRRTSIEFLKAGFSEHRISYAEDELLEAVELFDGYVGWLTYYGNFRCIRGMAHREALEEVYHEGKEIIRDELARFLRDRKKDVYLRLLRLLPSKWSDLYRALGVNSKVLAEMLKSLKNAMIINKLGDTYYITDPIMKRLIMEF